MALFQDQFQAKRVVVTGAGKGVGRALATTLHGLGAQVYAVTRSQADLDTLVAECPGVHPIQLDISNWEETKRVLTEKIPQNVDVLINNAAVLGTAPLPTVSEEEIDRIMTTNVKAQINITQVCVSKMIAARTAGVVVNISSVAGLRPFAMYPLYSASKAALDALTKTMAVEFGKHKIRVLGFNPAGIQTNMAAQSMNLDPEVQAKMQEMMVGRYPLGEFMLPMEQVVNTILFLASGIAGMMTGSSVVLDGGFLAT